MYGDGEAEAMAHEVLQFVSGLSRLQRLSSANENLAPETAEKLTKISADLLRGRPLQYTLGEAWFCGLRIAVNEAALIPRPETEELVAWMLESKTADAKPRILDLGTGTGCIALALKHALPTATITGLDLSEAALTLSRENAAALGLNVNFISGDILAGLSPQLGKWDIIVSNPPYIPISEKAQMAAHVTEHEPSLALFTPADDVLIFYRAIAATANARLNPGGRVYVETHCDFAQETADIFSTAGFGEVEVRRDMQGKERMVMGIV